MFRKIAAFNCKFFITRANTFEKRTLSFYFCAFPQGPVPPYGLEGNEHDKHSAHLLSNDASTPFDERRILSDAKSYCATMSENTHRQTQEYEQN